eukprot:PLAT5616.1.p1 GENE.PLAT5616.1~~PLAT5616.1.p1  ORF type:complete len:389 (-),score=185.98 PLAT5616.1:56-1222(-)
MASEVQQALRYTSDLLLSRFKELCATQARERRRFVASLRSQLAELQGELSCPLTGATVDSSSDAALERGRAALRGDVVVEEAALKDWALAERYNFHTAFSLQLDKVEEEWKAYTARMETEFEARAAALGGKLRRHSRDEGDAASGGAPAGSGKRRWMDNAKQEMLIHTAPVLSPTARTGGGGGGGRAGGGGGGGGVGGVRGAAAGRTSARMAALRREFAESVRAVQAQREEAVRWIMRQRTRLLLHVDVADAEARAKHALQAEEQADWVAALATLQAAGRALQECATLPTEAPACLAGRKKRGAAHAAASAVRSSPLLSMPAASRASAARRRAEGGHGRLAGRLAASRAAGGAARSSSRASSRAGVRSASRSTSRAGSRAAGRPRVYR